MKILFIGADIQTVETVAEYLSQRWPDAKTAHKATVEESLAIIEETSPDAAFFYTNFPDIEASAAAISQLRRVSDIPLLVLSPQRGEQEVVTALHFGADDYVKLPCGTPELMARVSGLLRRAGSVIRHDAEKPVFKSDMVMNPASKEVLMGNRNVALTRSQFKLLSRMMIAPIETALREEPDSGILKRDESGPLERYAEHVVERNDKATQGSTQAAETFDRLFLDAPK